MFEKVGHRGWEIRHNLICSNNMDNYPLMTQYDTSNLGNAPSANPSPTAAPNSVVASWSFGNIDSNGVTSDSTGKNSAILGSTNGNKSYIPAQVNGKFGNALSFNGESYVNVPTSPSLETSADATVDVWINVQSFKDVTYNNILVECVRTTDALPTRTFGLAINGEAPQNASFPPVGALRAYVLTKNEGLNEVVTKESVVPLNQWIHVVFTRSLTTGMHIYVDGQEQVNVTAGVANPSGSIMRQNEIYIGHDAICIIDELQVSNMVEPRAQPLWMQWWLWTIIFAGVVGSGLMLYHKKHGRGSLSKKLNPV